MCRVSGISPVHLRNFTLMLTDYNIRVNVQLSRTTTITDPCSPTSSRSNITLIIILIFESTKARIMELLRNLILVLTLMRLYVYADNWVNYLHGFTNCWPHSNDLPPARILRYRYSSFIEELSSLSVTGYLEEWFKEHINALQHRSYVYNVYWTVHHCNIWRMKDQLDVTCYFISLIVRSTCFGYFAGFSLQNEHHQITAATKTPTHNELRTRRPMW